MENWEVTWNNLINSLPKVERTTDEWDEIQKKNREEDALFYTNRDEKGYCIK